MFFSGRDILSRERRAELASFQRHANLKFRNLELLNLSLTHRSCTNEDPRHALNNERLEFLGDAVLGLVAASCLYELLKDRSEGELARVKSYVVSEETLSGFARQLEIDRYILLGKGEEQSGGREKRAIIADAMEAVIGALFLDSGFETSRSFVLGLIEPEVKKVLQNRHRKDYKTILQEYTQKYLHIYPIYRLDKRSGPDHDRTFWVSCEVDGESYGPISGKNKKEAEQSAAKAACEEIIAAGGLASARLLQLENQ